MLRRMGLPVWAAAFAGGLLLCLYGVMTGLGVSACRAIGMYLLRMLGELWGRTYDMLTALGLVGAAAVLANPLYLHHAGFLLSYGAVLGIGVLQPALFRKMPKAGGNRREKESFFLWVKGLFKKLWGWAVQTAAASISVALITLPVLLWFYYEVPVYAVLLNLFVLPLMKPIMFFGMLGMLVPFLQRAGEICTLLLKLCEDCCLIFEKLPFHTWNPGKPMLWQVVCYYLLLAAAGFFSVSSNKCKKGRSLSAKGMCLAGAVLVLSLQALPEEKITFLDVGQGDSICIQTAAGDCCVFDCGSSSRSGVGKYVLIPFLKQEGISHVDAVFLSHPDKDHCSGIEELLLDGQGITVGELVLPDVQEEKKQEEFESLLSAVQKGEEATGRKIRVSYISAGTFFQSGELSFTCLHPPKGFTAEDANGYSECFYVKKQGTGMSLLLTGDVEGEGEELLIKELKQRGIQGASLLKAGHHGSENATGQELLELIKPELTIISCGKNNRYGHPREEVLERLEKIGCIVLKTPDTGAVTVKYQRGHIWAEPYLKPDA